MHNHIEINPMVFISLQMQLLKYVHHNQLIILQRTEPSFTGYNIILILFGEVIKMRLLNGQQERVQLCRLVLHVITNHYSTQLASVCAVKSSGARECQCYCLYLWSIQLCHYINAHYEPATGNTKSSIPHAKFSPVDCLLGN